MSKDLPSKRIQTQKLWTAEENKVLHDLLKNEINMSYFDIAEKFGRSVGAIRVRLYNLKKGKLKLDETDFNPKIDLSTKETLKNSQ